MLGIFLKLFRKSRKIHRRPPLSQCFGPRDSPANNTIYAANRVKNEILIWTKDSVDPTKTISGTLSDPYSIFVTYNGDIYINNGGEPNRRVDKWILSTDTLVTVMNVNASCFAIFVDMNDILYCSIYEQHKVMRQWLIHNDIIITIVVGTDSNGSALNERNGPMGIFVELNFDLYVADCANDRIQLFQSEQINAKTIAGVSSSDISIPLSSPNGILANTDKYLFIVDGSNHRIVGSGPNGFRCLIGCNDRGSESNQ
ncbi:unnamed protein product [Adineta steineri]|uniref:NHL repeat containing protein-like protein n=1 Tax=Adineta steineri TaxID=433720 RepID=A0A814NIQ6_9BILA|nr:unnamed protein product [Adineta steineri]CAF0948693.1 unnamed protein product [Adineta steineri]CAF1094208.1 unnamed protein product [Adineta steineri]